MHVLSQYHLRFLTILANNVNLVSSSKVSVILNSVKSTYITNHGYVAGLSDYGFDVARAFWSKESCDPVADHIDHRLGGFHRFSPRVVPSHHQLYVR